MWTGDQCLLEPSREPGLSFFGVVVYFGFRFIVLVLGAGLGLVSLGSFRVGVRGRFWLGPGTQLDPLVVYCP